MHCPPRSPAGVDLAQTLPRAHDTRINAQDVAVPHYSRALPPVKDCGRALHPVENLEWSPSYGKPRFHARTGFGLRYSQGGWVLLGVSSSGAMPPTRAQSARGDAARAQRLKRHISGHLVRTEMVAMMVVRVMLWGPHHSFMGSLDASAPANQRIYRLQIDRTAGDRAASTSRAALSDGEELPPPRVELHLRTL
jgi:hypothetical protein